MKDVLTKDGRPSGTPAPVQHEENFSRERYTYALRDHPDLFKGKTLLDIGCGWGGGTTELVKRGAKKVYAVDFNQHAIELAKEKYNHENINYYVDDILNFTIKPETVDGVIAVEIVEHVTDNELSLLLNGLWSQLKSNGFLYITTPEIRGNKKDFPRGSHWTEYDFQELVDVVESHGFKLQWHLRKNQTDRISMALLFHKQ